MARHGENIRKRNDGRWEARLLIGHMATGEACYKSFYSRSYAQAKAKRAKYLQDMEEDTVALESGCLFSQLLDDWLFFIQIGVKETTFSKYKHDIEKHIRPDLGDYQVVEISTELLEHYSRNKLQNGRRDGNGGLSPKTVCGLLAIIKQALEYGRDKGYGCQKTVRIHNPKQFLPDIQVLSHEEQQELELTIRKEMTLTGAGILLTLYTGLRLGEICALRWEDVRLDSGLLMVRHTMKRIQTTDEGSPAKTKVIIGTPKTDHSMRMIPLPQFLIPALRVYERPDDHYFLTGTMQYIEPRGFYRKYRKFMKEIGLEQYNYHALRHTFATRCVEMGVDTKTLSEILGHADVSITLRRYVHSTLEMKKQQIEKLAEHSIYGQKIGQESQTFRKEA